MGSAYLHLCIVCIPVDSSLHSGHSYEAPRKSEQGNSNSLIQAINTMKSQLVRLLRVISQSVPETADVPSPSSHSQWKMLQTHPLVSVSCPVQSRTRRNQTSAVMWQPSPGTRSCLLSVDFLLIRSCNRYRIMTALCMRTRCYRVMILYTNLMLGFLFS